MARILLLKTHCDQTMCVVPAAMKAQYLLSWQFSSI